MQKPWEILFDELVEALLREIVPALRIFVAAAISMSLVILPHVMSCTSAVLALKSMAASLGSSARPSSASPA